MTESRELAKKKRTTARAKYTRILNVILEDVDDDNISMEALRSTYSDLDDAYKNLEVETDEYVSFLILQMTKLTVQIAPYRSHTGTGALFVTR